MGSDGCDDHIAFGIVVLARNYDRWPRTLCKTISVRKWNQNNVGRIKRHRASSSHHKWRLGDWTIPPPIDSFPAPSNLLSHRPDEFRHPPRCRQRDLEAGPTRRFDCDIGL